MSDEKNSTVEQAKAARDRYRGSGMALMTTVITLAAGGLFGLKPTDSGDKLLAFALFTPIVMALLQQLLCYIGQFLEARDAIASIFSEARLRVLSIPQMTPEQKKDVLEKHIEHFKKDVNRQVWANRCFEVADMLCVAAVLVLIGSGGWIVWCLPEHSKTVAQNVSIQASPNCDAHPNALRTSAARTSKP